MRHVRSILYALVLAPTVWVLTGAGLTSDLASRGRDDFAVETYVGLLMLLLAGSAYAILVFAPISPAGPTFAGVVFLAVTLWALHAPTGYADLWPDGVSKEGFDLSRPGYGMAALLAVPLLATALSVRRWQRYDPPVLPIIGQIGRARGAARVAGTPMGADETTVIGVRTPGVGTSDPEPTTVIRLPGTGGGPDRTAGRADEGDRTIVFPTGEHEATILLAQEPRTVEVAAPTDDDPTTMLVPATSPEPTVADAPAVADQTETVDVAGSAADEPAAVEVPESTPEEPETVDVTEDAAEEPETGDAGAGASEDEPADEVTSALPPPENIEQTRDLSHADPDRTAAVRFLPDDDGETTRPLLLPENIERTRDLSHADPDRTAAITLPRDDDGESTRPLLLPANIRPENIDRTRDLSQGDPDRTGTITVPAADDDPATHDPATHDLARDDGEMTRDLALGDPDRTGVVVDAERTQKLPDPDGTRDLSAPSPDRTMPIGGPDAGPARPDDPDRTQYLSFVSPDPDAVQPIRFPPPDAGAGPVAPVSGPGEGIRRIQVDAETPVVPAPRGTVEPPADRTEVFRVPASIADAEAPNFAEDPTGRIVPPGSAPAGDEPERDERSMTATRMERPGDETSSIPAQRRPAEDD